MRRRPSSKNRTPVPLHATEQAPSLQSAHESIIAAQVKTKVWLELRGEFMIGDGGLHLLGGIAEHGSLAQAVRKIRWSYRHAWGYLRRAERALETPIVRNRPGRGTARGMELTVTGRLLLERLRALRDRIDDALGPTGPTLAEVAARGRPARSPVGSRRAGSSRWAPPPPSSPGSSSPRG